MENERTEPEKTRYEPPRVVDLGEVGRAMTACTGGKGDAESCSGGGQAGGICGGGGGDS